MWSLRKKVESMIDEVMDDEEYRDDFDDVDDVDFD